MSNDPLHEERFKATQMIRGQKSKDLYLVQWKEAVARFCVGIPRKKHRKHMKSYPDCFIARKAVDWVHEYLVSNAYFGKNAVTRHQAVQLLRKFLRCDIIRMVYAKENEVYEFMDNKDLYCITSSVKDKLTSEPLASSLVTPSTPGEEGFASRRSQEVYSRQERRPLRPTLENPPVVTRSECNMSAAQASQVRTSAIPIVVRQLDAVIRISDSLAKMQLSPLVAAVHVEEALRLFKVATLRAGMTGNLDGAENSTVREEQLFQVENEVKRRFPVGHQVSESLREALSRSSS